MASIRKLPSGRWNVQIRMKGHAPVSNSFLSKADADKWLRLTESEIERGVFVDRSEAESTTLEQALERYLNEVTPDKKGALQETNRIRVWQCNTLAKRPLSSLKGSDFASYRNKRLTEVSNATVRLELAIISHLYTVAIQDWGIQGITNPIKHIRKPKVSNARDRRITSEEMKRLLDACRDSKNPQLHSLAILAIETGMRLGEMISLEWNQVDIAKKVIQLHDTKNGLPRLVPLSFHAIEELLAQPRAIQCNRVFYSWCKSGGIKKSWHTALNKAGIEDFRFHDLRHEATSRFFEKGLNMVEVACVTGHKTMQMLKRYTHPRIEGILNKIG